MRQKSCRSTWKRFSLSCQKKIHRHEDRISDNFEYRDADLTAMTDRCPRGDDDGTDEVRQFYRLRLRDAEAFDRPWLQLADFFDHDQNSVLVIEWVIPMLDVLMLHRALEHFLAEWNELPTTPRSCDLFLPLQHLAVEIAPEKWEHAPVECMRFWRHADGRRVCVDLELMRGSKCRVGFPLARPHHRCRGTGTLRRRLNPRHAAVPNGVGSHRGRLSPRRKTPPHRKTTPNRLWRMNRMSPQGKVLG